MKIAFANTIGDACQKWNANPHKVLSAIGADTRIGEKNLKYGYGFGGPCFPRDNKAMLKAGEKIAFEFYFPATTIRENERHTRHQIEQLLLQDLERYYFASIGYKEGSDIIEESQQLA